MHERELPEALTADLEGSFPRLVEIYQDRLYAFALRLSGNPQDAEEILVDAFVRAHQALGRYAEGRLRALALRPWLYRITLNVFRNRARRRRLPTTPLDPAGAQTAWEAEDNAAGRPDAVLERAELREILAARLAELPERERVAVVLRHVQGLGYGEIAALLSQPVGTVKANVHRGLRRLREALNAYEEWR